MFFIAPFDIISVVLRGAEEGSDPKIFLSISASASDAVAVNP